MGRLRDQMQMEMELRNYSSRTMKSYLGYMTAFTRMFRRSPAEMGEEEIRQYLHHLKTVKKASSSSINIAYSALKFFYEKTLHRQWKVEQIPRPKVEKRLPVVLSRSEVKQIFDGVENLRHRVMLMTTYSGGLRVSETAHLKITDIDSALMLIRVEQGKGKQDRYTLLSERLLLTLREYYREYRPRYWLFAGSKPGRPIGVDTIQKAFRDAKKKQVSRSQRVFILSGIVLPRIF